MKVKALILSVMLAVSGAGVINGAQAAVSVDIRVAPPAPRVEVVPGPRVGYIWAPGYWRWRGHQYVWVTGHWVRERRGYHWVPERWEPVGPGWHFHRGYWRR
ncbi:MAG: YXWGXW repeat-containing protein [Steroidobacteraceae bacterium]